MVKLYAYSYICHFKCVYCVAKFVIFCFSLWFNLSLAKLFVSESETYTYFSDKFDNSYTLEATGVVAVLSYTKLIMNYSQIRTSNFTVKITAVARKFEYGSHLVRVQIVIPTGTENLKSLTIPFLNQCIDELSSLTMQYCCKKRPFVDWHDALKGAKPEYSEFNLSVLKDYKKLVR